MLKVSLSLFLPLLFLSSLWAGQKELPATKIQLPNGRMVAVRLAITPKEQQKGLGQLDLANFQKDKEGMVFLYKNTRFRRFWMLGTRFPLDIYFLDKNWKIVHKEMNLPPHSSLTPTKSIATTEYIKCQHVLELAAGSVLSTGLKV